MPKLKINTIEIEVAKDTTLLEAANEMNINIPTLCYLKGYEFFTSCMICVVLDKKSDKLIPACSIFAEEGMDIETENARIEGARKDTIDMLLGEHVGDCEATCTKGCPANMNIPKMIREIKSEEFQEAIKTVKMHIALPAVLGRICSAPCENACIHRQQDTSISICELKRVVADLDLEQETPYKPEISEKKNKKVAVIGAGPTGLSAIYYLTIKGYYCTLFDKNDKPGGELQYGVPEEKLDKEVLQKEIKQILGLDINYQPQKILGDNIFLRNLSKDFDAVVIAVGNVETDIFDGILELTEKGIKVNKNNFQTKIPNVFAGGNSIREGRSTIRSSAHGKQIAENIDSYLSNGTANGIKKRFNSVLGKLKPGELEEFSKGSKIFEKTKIDNYSYDEAVEEAKRCFHCDCRKVDNCRLRDYADSYNGDQKKYKVKTRNSFKRINQHSDVLFEPGKCIKCNLCVQITEKAGEKYGLVMAKRGFEIEIKIPFNEPFSEGLKKVAKECVEACPTAAISWINERKD